MTKRIGVVFPGYGEQFIGMGKDLYDQLRTVQEFFEQAAGVVDINFVKLCFASSDEEISSIKNAYLAIYLYECSLYEIMRQKGLRADFIAGYGIGEYASCFAAESLSFIDGMYFINKYAHFYDDFVKSKKDYTVLRITRGFTKESLQSLIDSLVDQSMTAYIAAQNGLNSFYVAGDKKVIKKIQEYCRSHVIRKVKDVGPAYGMYGSVMNEIADQLQLYYHKITFKPLQTPVITNVDGVYVTTADALQSAMMRKVNNQIQWFDVMQGFEGCDIVISVGPGNQLIEWFKEFYPDKEYFSIMTLKDIESIAHLFYVEPMVEPIVESIETAQENQPKDLHEADLINELSSDYDVEQDDEE